MKSTSRASLNLLLQRSKEGTLQGPSLTKRLSTDKAQSVRNGTSSKLAADQQPVPFSVSKPDPNDPYFSEGLLKNPTLSTGDYADLASHSRTKGPAQPYTESADAATSLWSTVAKQPWLKGSLQTLSLPLQIAGAVGTQPYDARESFENARVDGGRPVERSLGSYYNDVGTLDQTVRPAAAVVNTLADAKAQASMVSNPSLLGKAALIPGVLAPEIIGGASALSRGDTKTLQDVGTTAGIKTTGLGASYLVNKAIQNEAARATAAGLSRVAPSAASRVGGALLGRAALPIAAANALAGAYNTHTTDPKDNPDGLDYRALYDSSGRLGRVGATILHPIEAGKQSNRLGGVFNPGYWWDTLSNKPVEDLPLSSAGSISRDTVKQNEEEIKRNKDLAEGMKAFVISSKLDPTLPEEIKNLPLDVKRMVGYRLAQNKYLGHEGQPLTQEDINSPEYGEVLKQLQTRVGYTNQAMGFKDYNITPEQDKVLRAVLNRYGDPDVAVMAASRSPVGSNESNVQSTNKRISDRRYEFMDYLNSLPPR